MKKQEFLCELKNRLSGLPQEDISRTLDYYSELIDDYIEDGKSEEEAVSSLDSIDDIVSQILMDTPLKTLVKAKVKPSRAFRVWEIILLILGSPIWLSLLIALFSVVLSIYITLWSVIVALFAVVLVLLLCSIALFVASIVLLFSGNFVHFAVFIGATMLCSGITILLFIASFYITKGVVYLSKKIIQLMKKPFLRKGEK